MWQCRSLCVVFTLWWFGELCAGKQALNHGIFVGFKEKESRHTDFNHISHWARYTAIDASVVSNEKASKSIFIISIYWAQPVMFLQREASELSKAWLATFSRTPSTLFLNVLCYSCHSVCACVPVYCKHQFVKLLLEQHKINMTPFLFYKHLNS